MALWNQTTWNSGALWGPTAAPPQNPNPTSKPHKKEMKRQPYFPRANGDRPGWFTNFANELPGANTTLALPAASVTSIVADLVHLAYASGPWLVAVREFGPAATAGLQTLYYGTNPGPYALPEFVAPELAGGGAPVPVPAGALNRVFAFVQTIKNAPTYTVEIGLQLGIVGAEDTVDPSLPTFTLSLERGGGSCECVRLKFNKFDHDAILVQSRRGGSLEWEMLGIDTASPYLDERPLLVAGTPEVREYRLQFYDDSAPSSAFTDPQSVTVTP